MTHAELEFSYNWNNKLDSDFYTTLRLHNPDKYVLGRIYDVKLKGKSHHKAVLVSGKILKLANINEFIADLDTGYSVEECKNIIKKMYPNANWDTQDIGLYLMQKIKEKSNNKIAIFCRFFMEYKQGQKYKTSKAESGMIKDVEVTELLCKAYFECNEWWCKVKSISNYCKYINEIRGLTLGSNSKYLSYWSKAYEKKLPTEELSLYWAHLRSLGLKPKRDLTNTIIEWTKDGL